MATRSLTEIFILMRNNSLQNRNIYSEQMSNDRSALVAAVDDEEIELGNIPPAWASIVEDIHYTMVRLKAKIKAFNEVVDNTLLRPSFDDSKENETQMKSIREEIMRMYNGVYRSIGQIYSETSHAQSNLEKRLVTSVTKALVSEIQNVYSEFKSIENNYQSKMKSRQERTNKYFETVDLEERSYDNENLDSSNGLNEGWFDEQQFLDDRKLIEKEQQVGKVLESVIELRDIYHEVNRLIVDQGTVLDRIDYNIEVTSMKVKKATSDVEKVSRAYHKKNKKLYCILILSVILITLIPTLIITKT
ncbi:hypothetical protein O3M35_004444 [Rhynocoris fuscipes]|uniref:t-SNARE coiled-coil homology domain-containing protein n=1 Tax=Rhynocoris fuscipes TaxID=488301 RepID=A0AAW1CLF8_9HEMI